MSVNSRFAVAVHILVMLALEDRPLTSKLISASVNTNPVVIRRLLGVLSKAGLIETQRGVEGGSHLACPPEEITLLQVYEITGQGQLFALHTNEPNQLCPCGRNIQPLLKNVFSEAETALETTLAKTTVAEVMRNIQAQTNQA